ncbi:MAG: hypothetical protein M1819_002169 [Sarea resinae]|nr:MAG: hypothetical protein M1819_002169 [Sarea resinae]
MALMSHLAEIHLSDSLESFADDVLMRTLLMQSHLENTAAALSHAKIMVQSKVSSDEEISHHFAQKIESVVSHSRSAKVVVGKTIRSLEELKARSLSLTTDTILSFEHAENGTRELASYTIQLSEDLFALLNEEGRTEPFTFGDVQSVIAKTTESVFQTQEGDILAALSNKLRSLTNQLVDLGSLTSDLEMTAEFERGPAPWVIRSKELKSTKIVSIDTEEEIRRLKDDIHERATQLRLRDQTLEESAVKIELLESRMRDATKKGNQIHELERLLDEGRSREKDLADAIETQTQELQALESERDKWKRLADEKRATASGLADSSLQAKEGAEKAVATAREMEALKADILALQASVRYLRTDNRRLRTARDNVASGRALDFLDTPLLSRDRRSNSRGNDGAYVGHGAREESQRRLLEQEGHDVLAELLNLASNPKYAQKVDLGLLPKDNRTGWRPAKETPGYHVARQREYFESWKAWGEGVAKRAHAHSLASCRNNEAVAVVDTDGPRNGNGNDKGAEDRRRQKTKRRSRTAGVTLAPAARMDFYGRGSGARGLPLDDDGKENVQGTGLRARSPLGITVRRPDEWEALGSLVGFAQ